LAKFVFCRFAVGESLGRFDGLSTPIVLDKMPDLTTASAGEQP
jgi:hypothetical protein